MRKIPTLFVRDWDGDRRYVLPEVTPGCEWVLAGEGTATRKYDGTCVMYEPGKRVGLTPRSYDWWFRREIKPGKTPPADYLEIAFDEETGKSYGWEPAIEGHPFRKYLEQATTVALGFTPGGQRRPGTYELVGPRINGNPEGYGVHTLIYHDGADVLLDAPRDFGALAKWLHEHPYEGIVWHHPDGRMAKIKRKDFPEPVTDLSPLQWRTGRTLGRTVYARTGGDDYKADTVLGILDTPELAERACADHNALADLAWLIAAGLEVTFRDAARDGDTPDYAVIIAANSRRVHIGGNGTLASALEAARTWAEAEGLAP